MRVDYQVRDHAVDGERHVLGRDQAADDALLTVATGELVAQFGNTVGSQCDAHQPAGIEALGDEHVVYVTPFSMADVHARLLAILPHHEGTMALLQEARRTGLADHHAGIVFSLARQEGLRNGQAIELQVVVLVTLLAPLDLVGAGSGNLDLLDLSTGVATALGGVGAHERRAAERTLYRGAVQDDRVLHVVALMGEHRDDVVLAAGAMDQIGRGHRLRADDRTLRVVQHVRTGVRAQAVVGGTQSEALLDHRRATGDPRSRVVLRVGDQACAHTQNELGVDLDVGVDEYVLRALLGAAQLVGILLIIGQRHFEAFLFPLAVRHLDAYAEVGLADVLLAEVEPLDVVGVDRSVVFG